MKTKISLLLILFTLSLSAAPKESGNDLGDVSEAIGFMMGKKLEDLGFHLDMERVAKGMKESLEGKSSLMTEEETMQALTAIGENFIKQAAEMNLTQAAAFLQENAKKEGVHEIQPGKLQYKVEKEGKGNAVEASYSPLVRYNGRYGNGTVFSVTEEPERLSLEEIPEGMKLGVLGMKEGETRTIYIHPELGFGTDDAFFPNSLLMIEVEVIQADGPANTAAALPTKIADDLFIR